MRRDETSRPVEGTVERTGSVRPSSGQISWGELVSGKGVFRAVTLLLCREMGRGIEFPCAWDRDPC